MCVCVLSRCVWLCVTLWTLFTGILQARILEWVALLQGIFPNQGSDLCLLHLLHWQARATWEAVYEAIIVSLFKVLIYMHIFHLPYWYHNQYCHEYLDVCAWAGASQQCRARTGSSGLLDSPVPNFFERWCYCLHNDCSSFNCG